ncbi:Peroxiredoxin [uncultured archaeon]|nr:Peroxiredoxin [uncultured archaeon]
MVAMIALGDMAPDFDLSGSDGKRHTLGEFKGRRLVLYFYPKDGTPGCTTEACSFRDSNDAIRALGAEVVGISKDTIESHGRFREKQGLNFLLLSDTDSKTIKAYDAYGPGLFGMGTLRKTYIVDRSGKIVKIYEKVRPDGHAQEIIEFLKSPK